MDKKNHLTSNNNEKSKEAVVVNNKTNIKNEIKVIVYNNHSYPPGVPLH